jgi:hypothetical protein
VQGDAQHYEKRLAAYALSLGIRLEYSAAIRPARGISEGGKITLLPDLDSTEDAAVLAHELGHEILQTGTAAAPLAGSIGRDSYPKLCGGHNGIRQGGRSYAAVEIRDCRKHKRAGNDSIRPSSIKRPAFHSMTLRCRRLLFLRRIPTPHRLLDFCLTLLLDAHVNLCHAPNNLDFARVTEASGLDAGVWVRNEGKDTVLELAPAAGIPSSDVQEVDRPCKRSRALLDRFILDMRLIWTKVPGRISGDIVRS